MTVEILSTVIENGYVSITVIDCSEEHLQRMKRIRDDGVSDGTLWEVHTAL